ncbi:hypothetical protein OFL77_27755, partial [Escherichia coli]|uniref:hypothetical protein n=1 Tax=Escherichia coli TaxID=562 RepID=UPI0021E00B83
SSATFENIELAVLEAKLAAEENNNAELSSKLDVLFDDKGEIDIFWIKEIDYYMRNSLGLKAKKRKKENLAKITEEDTD